METPPSKLRELQDQMANAGWRIPLIPYDDSSQAMKIQTNWYAVIGMIAFLGGIWFYLQHHQIKYLCIAVAGFAFACLGLIFIGRKKRRGWIKIDAACVDRETVRFYSPGSAPVLGGYQWAFRLLCKFTFDGKAFSVTPVFWRSFGSEEAVQSFFGKNY